MPVELYKRRLKVLPATGGFVSATELSGTMLSTRAFAAGQNVRLPDPTLALAGMELELLCVANQTVTFRNTSGTAPKMVALNNAATTSVTMATAGQVVGARCWAVCDGVQWIVVGTTPGVTYAVG